ncbi:hypothetical protein [Nocardioides gansuensis]|nr:hypothetical protein [Nocardioides gansuensis]
MLNIKKTIIAFAIALMATVGTVGTVAPAEAGGAKTSRVGDGWCC